MLEAVDAVCHLDLADKAVSTFMREVRGFAATLRGVTFDTLLPLTVMIALNREQFAGIIARYKTGWSLLRDAQCWKDETAWECHRLAC